MSSTRGLLTCFAAVTCALLAACGDRTPEVGAATLRQVANGIHADSLYRIIGTGPLQPATAAESLQVDRGFRRSRYFVNGVSYDVIWYREVPAPVDSAIDVATVSPVLLRNDTVQGWGWKYFDQASAAINVPNPKAERLRN
jgi:hypothetical protein